MQGAFPPILGLYSTGSAKYAQPDEDANQRQPEESEGKSTVANEIAESTIIQPAKRLLSEFDPISFDIPAMVVDFRRRSIFSGLPKGLFKLVIDLVVGRPESILDICP